MKMKQYCLNVIHDFIKRDLVKIQYKGKQPLFDFKNLQPSFYSSYEFVDVKIYVGNGIEMVALIPDVVSFNKDGNLLTFNIKEILKEYKEKQNE